MYNLFLQMYRINYKSISYILASRNTFLERLTYLILYYILL